MVLSPLLSVSASLLILPFGHGDRKVLKEASSPGPGGSMCRTRSHCEGEMERWCLRSVDLSPLGWDAGKGLGSDDLVK